MTKYSFTSILLLLGITASSTAQTSYNALHFDDQKAYVVSNNQLERPLKNNSLEKMIDFSQAVNTSLVHNKELWVGTKKGIFIYSLSKLALLRTKFTDTAIAGLAKDAAGKIWVATAFKGVYRQNAQNNFDAKLNVMTNYCIAATPDGNVYVGTNLGLYQIPIADETNIVRYAEEAHSGHGLPDNLVENLFTDDASNVWVMMPDNLSFKKSDNSFGEIPTFAFVGNKDNKIYKVVGLSHDNYLFVTSDGVIFVPSTSLHDHGHGDEVFSAHDAAAVVLSKEALSTPGNLEGETILSAQKHKDDIYFFTAKGIWKVKEKKLFKKLKKKPAAA